MRKQSQYWSFGLLVTVLIIFFVGANSFAQSTKAFTKATTNTFTQQLAKLPASCPEKTMYWINLTPGIGVNLGITSSGEEIKAEETSFAIGKVTGVYTYSIMVGTINFPSDVQGHGFISVSKIPADACYYNKLVSAGAAPKIPAASLLNRTIPAGIAAITGISGDILSFQETTGTAGQFNYVTGAFATK